MSTGVDFYAFGEERFPLREYRKYLSGSFCGPVAVRTELTRPTATHSSNTDFISSDQPDWLSPWSVVLSGKFIAPNLAKK